MMKEIIIVSDDRPGMVAEIAEALAAVHVNIESLDVETIGGSKVAALTVDRYDDALRGLARTRFQAISEDALVLQLADKPGELARITRRLKDAQIDVRSVRIIRRESGTGIIAVATDRNNDARKLLGDVMVSWPR